MILWRLYQRRLEEAIEQAKIEAKTEGMAEGRAEGEAAGMARNYELWIAWNNRRIEAEEQNLPFDEPPPPPPRWMLTHKQFLNSTVLSKVYLRL